MATPGELVKVIAATTGEDEATVTQHDRNLVIAGLRPKHGRGRNSYKVTARDAAILLTSVLGSHRVRDGVDTVRRYQQTQEHRAHWFQHWPADKQTGMGPANVWENFDIPELTALPPEHTFIDALTVLITLAAEGRLIPKLHQPGPFSFGDLRIIVSSPRAHARISMSRYRGKDDHKSVQADYGSNEPPSDWMKGKTKELPKSEPEYVNPRIERWCEMKGMPLFYIGALLGGKLDELPKIERTQGDL